MPHRNANSVPGPPPRRLRGLIVARQRHIVIIGILLSAALSFTLPAAAPGGALAATVPRVALDTPTAATPPLWTLGLAHREERMRGIRLRGITRLSGLRRVARGAVLAEVLGLTESTRSSLGFGAELYTPLWHYAEAHVRASSAPRALSLPELLVGAEVTQHLQAGWHASVSADHRRYEALKVNLVMLGGGWSSERWFVRARTGTLHAGAQTMLTANALVRRLLRDGRTRVELFAGAGGDVLDFRDPTAPGSPLTSNSVSAGVNVQLPIASYAALTGGAGVADYGDHGRRMHLEAGLILTAR